MALYALTVLVFSTTRSSSAVSALLVSFVLPQIVLSPFAGVIVDRLNLRWALVVPNFLRMVMTAGLAMAGADVPVLLALNLGISLMSVALTPAEGAMIPRVVPKAQLETAMSVFNLTLQASFAVGFAFLGPLLVTIAGPSFVLGIVTAFYVASTIATVATAERSPAAARARSTSHDVARTDRPAPRRVPRRPSEPRHQSTRSSCSRPRPRSPGCSA